MHKFKIWRILLTKSYLIEKTFLYLYLYIYLRDIYASKAKKAQAIIFDEIKTEQCMTHVSTKMKQNAK